MTEPVTKLPDPNAELRAHLVARLAAGGDMLAVLAARIGVGALTLEVFVRGAHLAPWAAAALAVQLDAAEHDGRPL